jgi:hypothetical protein
VGGGDRSGGEVDRSGVVHDVDVLIVVRLLAAQPVPSGDRRSEGQNVSPARRSR